MDIDLNDSRKMSQALMRFEEIENQREKRKEFFLNLLMAIAGKDMAIGTTNEIGESPIRTDNVTKKTGENQLKALKIIHFLKAEFYHVIQIQNIIPIVSKRQIWE